MKVTVEEITGEVERMALTIVRPEESIPIALREMLEKFWFSAYKRGCED